VEGPFGNLGWRDHGSGYPGGYSNEHGSEKQMVHKYLNGIKDGCFPEH